VLVVCCRGMGDGLAVNGENGETGRRNLTFWPTAIRDIFFSVEFVPGSTWNYFDALCLKLCQDRLIIQPLLIEFWL
jgi:hypothetical protein